MPRIWGWRSCGRWRYVARQVFPHALKERSALDTSVKPSDTASRPRGLNPQQTRRGNPKRRNILVFNFSYSEIETRISCVGKLKFKNCYAIPK
jgi:hypothetical protein